MSQLPGPFHLLPGLQAGDRPAPEILARAAFCREDPAIRLLLETADQFALVLDEAFRIVAASGPVLEVLDLERVDPVLGLTPGDLFRCPGTTTGCGGMEGCQACGILLSVQACRREGAPASREALLPPPGEFMARATPLRSAGPPLVLLSLRDIGERKRLEALEQFFFRQVLNLAEGLEGTVRILSAMPQDTPLLIHQLADFTEQLTQEVMGQRILLQAENGSLQVEFRDIELSEILESLGAFFRNQDVAHRRRLELPLHPSEHFRTDPALLLKLLADLIASAFEATPVDGTVRVEYLREEGWRRFTIRHTGALPAGSAAGVFRRSPRGGMRLGAFGLKLLAERYLEGSLQFSGEADGGCFTLALPAPEPLEEAGACPGEGAVPESGPVPPEHPGLGTVLVVDDMKVTRHLVQSVLAKDFRVVLADNGPEALALAAAHPPDLVVPDVVMPGMDGYSVCRKLKSDPRTVGVPIIFLTALLEKAHETQALASGAIDFITKPISPEVLYARVRNHVEMKQAQDRLKDLSLQDSLTGIANRRAFDGALEQEWRRGIRSRHPLSLIMGDVDFFKRYNDGLGHQQGDACLRRVAQAFAAALHRPGDLAARYGGEEFACILGDTDLDGAMRVAEAIREKVGALHMDHPDSDIGPGVLIELERKTASPVYFRGRACCLSGYKASSWSRSKARFW